MPAGQNHSNFALKTRLSAPRYDTWCKIQVLNFIDDYVPPPRFGEDLHFNLKAFKVGNELGIIMTDITDRNRSEWELKKRQAELERKTSDFKLR